MTHPRPYPVHTDAAGNLWANPGGGWVTLRDGNHLVEGGNGPEPVEPAPPPPLPPVPRWRLVLRRLLRRGYPR